MTAVVRVIALSLSLAPSVLPQPEGAVRFPDSPGFSVKISPCPLGEKFCELVPDYPTSQRVDHDLTENTLIKEKIFDRALTRTGAKSALLQTRIGGNPGERACSVVRSQIFPRKAVNTHGEYVFIINDDQYQQAVEIEQCVEEDVECKTDGDAPVSRNTVCRQKYSTHKLYAINAEKQQIYDSFSLPSACICHYKSQFRSSPSVRSSYKARGRRPRLPVCSGGTKLDLPTFVETFSTAQSQLSPSVENFVRRTSSAGRPFVHPEPQPRISRDFVYPGSFSRSRQERDTRRNNRRASRRGSGVTRRDKKRKQTSRSLGCTSSGKNYCEEPDTTNYPLDLARRLLAKNPAVGGKLFKQVFDNECSNINIATRFFSIEDEQLCRGRQKVIFPRTALNLNNEWRFVVNIDNFTQAVEIEGKWHYRYY